MFRSVAMIAVVSDGEICDGWVRMTWACPLVLVVPVRAESEPAFAFQDTGTPLTARPCESVNVATTSALAVPPFDVHTRAGDATTAA